MTLDDISQPTFAPPIRSLWRVARFAALLAFAFVVASIRIEECRIVPGAFSSGFSAGFDVSRKVCGQSALAIVLVHKIAHAIR